MMYDFAFPPLVVGGIFPLGIAQGTVYAALRTALERASYAVAVVDMVAEASGEPKFDPQEPLADRIDRRRDRAKEFRERVGRDDALALNAIRSINLLERQAIERGMDRTTRRCYVLRSFKRPEEIEALRRVYGPNFVLLGGHAPQQQRQEALARRLYETAGMGRPAGFSAIAIRLIDDERKGEAHGAQFHSAFHRADAFVRMDGSDDSIHRSVTRIVRLLLGDILETPTRDEQAMYHAYSASLQSGFLQRQVGAAITDSNSTLIAVGCNEVPRGGGGPYWTDDFPDGRDAANGRDLSQSLREQLAADFVVRMLEKGWSPPQSPNLANGSGRSTSDFGSVAKRHVQDGLYGADPYLKDSQLMDVIEFQRGVHAEMSAIVSAAQRGVALAGATLYTTTFPCHICAKHIVGSGLGRSVYIEPYPKSWAEELHGDALVIDPDDRSSSGGRVVFEAFAGVAPRRFASLFVVAPQERLVPGAGGQAIPRNSWTRGVTRWETRSESYAPSTAAVREGEERMLEFLSAADVVS